MPDSVPNKLCVIIVSDADANRLMERLVQKNLPATKIGSTGGFLQRGNATIISGVEESMVADVTEIVREECHARKEFVPVQTLPFLGDGGFSAEPVEVRVGGAIMFVIDVEQFIRT
ncbi:MAG TPA: cyclic-di-AMP receptor [Dehalococcoidia bacterium]|nr:cyclic-di-AMP receptor [Dehalococcoidia bacterium]